ncbi:unnamed protein product [Auanema sp. JU1783]|nr:unnamed protein product [Auanema sp. JU1783]
MAGRRGLRMGNLSQFQQSLPQATKTMLPNKPGIFGGDFPRESINVMHSLILNPRFLELYGVNPVVSRMILHHRHQIDDLLRRHANDMDEKTVMIIPYPRPPRQMGFGTGNRHNNWPCLYVSSCANFTTEPRPDVPGVSDMTKDPMFCHCCTIGEPYDCDTVTYLFGRQNE